MFHLFSQFIRQHFHLSQATVPRESIYPHHHRPLALLCILLILVQQAGMMQSFASFLTEKTLSPLLPTQHDTSWIASPKPASTEKKSIIPSNRIIVNTTQINAPQQTIPLLKERERVSGYGEWIGDFRKSPKPQKKPDI